jgi:pimeloyl-ACP methyl ester carboxylesterase
MKQIKPFRIYLLIAVAVVAGLVLNSCTNDLAIMGNQYFISSELKTTISTKQSLTNFTSLSPAAAIIANEIKNDVTVEKVTYKTTFRGKNIQASGLVCLPKEPGNYPILSFQNGTNTEHSKAPTENYDEDFFPIIESVASLGFIVVIPDYIGFGASSSYPHPYLDTKSSTQSILDLLRATNEYTSDNKILAKATKDLFIFGYSQGGWATMQLQKAIENDHSSEFNLIASSCGAGPYSIDYMNKCIVDQTEYPMPYFLAYLLNSYQSIGSFSNPLSDLIQQPYAGLIPGLFDGTNSGGTINSKLTTQMSNFLTAEYRTGYATGAKFVSVRSAFLTNSVIAWNAKTPMKLFHGANDGYIPVGISQQILADFKTKGVPVSQIELVIIPNADHTTAVYPAGLLTILWFLSFLK